MSKVAEKIEKLLSEVVKLVFKNTDAQKKAFGLLNKELKGLVVRSKDGITIHFKNEFSVKKGLDILKRKKLDKEIR